MKHCLECLIYDLQNVLNQLNIYLTVTEPEKDKEPEVEKVVETFEMESAPEPEPLPGLPLEHGSKPNKPPT